MKRSLEGLHAATTPQEIRRIRFVPAKNPDAVAVPEGLDILVLNAEQVRVTLQPPRRLSTT